MRPDSDKDHDSKIDFVCDEYERAFKVDPSARLEQFLGSAPDLNQESLFRELLLLELDLRGISQIESVLDELHHRFPEFTRLIDEILAMVEANTTVANSMSERLRSPDGADVAKLDATIESDRIQKATVRNSYDEPAAEDIFGSYLEPSNRTGWLKESKRFARIAPFATSAQTLAFSKQRIGYRRDGTSIRRSLEHGADTLRSVACCDEIGSFVE